MNKEEFERYYAKNSGMTVEALRAHKFVAIPCDCGEKDCKRWQMVTEAYVQSLRDLGVPILDENLREYAERIGNGEE